jgi:DNA-binding NtrC family response regulator
VANLLVVDDNREVAIPLIMVFELYGHAVRYAEDGQAGLEAIDVEFPELIVLDVDMPRLNGPDMAYRMVVKDAGRERIPILLLSGVYELGEVAKKVGTPYFLSKPYSIDGLMDLTTRALKERTPPNPIALDRAG